MGMIIAKAPQTFVRKFDPVAEATRKLRAGQMSKVREAVETLKKYGKPSVTVAEISDAIARRGWGLSPSKTYDQLIKYADKYRKGIGGARRHYDVQPDASRETLIEAIRNDAMKLIRGAVGLDKDAPVDKVAEALKKEGFNISG